MLSYKALVEGRRKIVVGITGASGAVYAQRLLYELSKIGNSVQVAVVFSENARVVWQHELALDLVHELANLAVAVYNNQDYSAPFASGSACFDTMFIVPCSMGAVARIANGLSSDLIARAADVMLKEKRRLILAPRETPYNAIHLRNMLALAELGAIIAPASPHFYAKPQNIDELVRGFVHRLLDLALLPVEEEAYRWGNKG